MNKNERKQSDNFDHNVKVIKKAMKRAGLNDQNTAAIMIKAELNEVESMSKEGAPFKDLTDQVLGVMQTAEAIIKIFRKRGERPSKKLSKQLDNVEAAGKALVITHKLTGEKNIKVRRMKSCEIEIIKVS